MQPACSTVLVDVICCLVISMQAHSDQKLVAVVGSFQAQFFSALTHLAQNLTPYFPFPLSAWLNMLEACLDKSIEFESDFPN